MLYGREAELAAIADLVARARDEGESAALIIRGDPGIGKTALLTAAASVAPEVRTIRSTGVEAESELPYSGLHLLLGRDLDRLDALPAVQAEALRGALGLAAVPSPRDRFLVGLAVLSLVSELAAGEPLVCLVDDAQWLDRASTDALLFAARRLGSEGVVMLFGARSGTGDFPAPGLPELRLGGLPGPAAAELLAAQGDLPPGVRYRILAESAGNPLALIELPHALGSYGGAGAGAGAGVGPGGEPLPLTERLRDAYEGQLRELPAGTRTLLLVAALDGTGELPVILRAGAELGASANDLEPARQARLVRAAERTLAFRHPLIRAAVHHAAPLGLRARAHRALAAALGDPDAAGRRAWHLAAAADGPDEEAAAELERAALARERTSDAGVWYERAAELSADPAARARRFTLAATSAVESGELDRAAALARRGARLTGDPLLAARLAEILATADFLHGDTAAGHRTLIAAATRVATVDAAVSGTLLIEAVHAAWYTGERELAESVARLEALELPAGARPAPLARLLIHAASPIVGRPADGFAAAQKDAQKKAKKEVRTDTRTEARTDEAFAVARRTADGNPRDLMLICGAALIMGRDLPAQEIAAELAGKLRREGMIGWLPGTLFYAASAQTYSGRLEAAGRTLAEALTLAADTAQQRWIDQLAELRAHLAAAAGDEEEVRRLADAARAAVREPTWGAPWTIWALGLLDLGLGRAESALTRLSELAGGRRCFHILATRSTPDLVEAAVRVGKPEAAAEPLELYERWVDHIGQPWAAAVLHRCRALLATGDADAERHFRAALSPAAAEFRPFEQARTRLLYGEWLRRAKRKAEARPHLAAALETFERIGARPWADRAGAELTATGVTSQGRAAAARSAETGGAKAAAATAGGGTASGTAGGVAALTPQELQIVRLAARGLTNKDIAARLFLSPRTVGSHLYRAYPKLGVLSRAELAAIDLGEEAL